MKLRDMQILSAGYLVLALLPSSGYSLCLMYNTTGLPCPGCGMTRAIHLLFHGSLLEAFRHNAVSIFLLPVLLFFTATIFWKRGGRYYENHRPLFNRGILAGGVLLLVYGGIRLAALLGFDERTRPGWLFASFHEPVLLEKIWSAFFR